ncbi:bactofilin family protein [Chitinimonas koreensis]|uniref:bactofilin family protein n=1 Tax=Chitinimonas koreensis TaxID=356302 RepID=UPI00223F9AF5|nr:polymer-forming cytoskeletal protein [Chitinimonas koreensis]
MTGTAAPGIATSGAAEPPTLADMLPASARPAEAAAFAVSASDLPESGARLIVGPNVKLKGADIHDCDTLVVEGRVEATMDSRVLRIAEQGAFSGKVSIDVAEIYGQFEGELTVRSQLIVHATGRVSGTVRYGKLLVEEGGELSGEVRALSAAAEARAEPARRSPPYEPARVEPVKSEGARVELLRGEGLPRVQTGTGAEGR